MVKEGATEEDGTTDDTVPARCRALGNRYEIGRTLGEGNFGKVKFARDVRTGLPYAIKILDRERIQHLKIDDQIKREIGTLKLLKHPNVVRLHEVSASKTKIYMVLEYVNGGELFDKIARKGKLSEKDGRKLFQQLIDGVSYCHDKGIYHRDLKPENVLIDAKGNIKISDFGLSALPQHLGVLSNRGYDGAQSDIWSCGVILYVILTGYLPFDDRNLVVLYQKIFKGDAQIPKWLSHGAQNILKSILNPNPITRIGVAEIKADAWFKQDYIPAVYDDDDDEDLSLDCKTLKVMEYNEPHVNGVDTPPHINAFELISMSSALDLSGFFEKEDVSERKIRFTSNYSPKSLFEKIEEIVTEMGFEVQKGNFKLKIMRRRKGLKSPDSTGSLSAAVEVFELSPALYVVQLRKSCGDSELYRQLCAKLSDDLSVCKKQQLVKTQSLMPELISSFEGEMPISTQ